MKAILLLVVFLAVPLAYAHGDKIQTPVAETVAEQTAWGIAGKPAQTHRIFALATTDSMRFSPDSLTVQEGATVPGGCLYQTGSE